MKRKLFNDFLNVSPKKRKPLNRASCTTIRPYNRFKTASNILQKKTLHIKPWKHNRLNQVSSFFTHAGSTNNKYTIINIINRW